MTRRRLPLRRRVWTLWVALASAALGCQQGSSDLVLVGTVERTLIELVAPVSERIIAIEVERGDTIQAGDVAVRLDPALALAELASAEAEAAGARTASVIAGHDYTRSRGLRARDVISEQALDAASLARDEAAARLWAAESRVSAARKRVADHTLVAPFSGVVDQLPFDEGERVPAGAVLCVILSDRAPWVRVWLPAPAYARVSAGTRAEVRVEGLAQTLRGRVLDIAREPEFTPHFALTERDRVHLVYETRVEIEDAPATLRPGAPADVRIPLDSSTAEARP
jgi:HlyD family secretion protein